MPADQPKPRRRRGQQAAQNASQTAQEEPSRAKRRRAALRQLTLVPEAPLARPKSLEPQPDKQRKRSSASRASESQ